MCDKLINWDGNSLALRSVRPKGSRVNAHLTSRPEVPFLRIRPAGKRPPPPPVPARFVPAGGAGGDTFFPVEEIIERRLAVSSPWRSLFFGPETNTGATTLLGNSNGKVLRFFDFLFARPLEAVVPSQSLEARSMLSAFRNADC